jgi:hypothetical protein
MTLTISRKKAGVIPQRKKYVKYKVELMIILVMMTFPFAVTTNNIILRQSRLIMNLGAQL